jgi:hypothetical protein
VAVQQATGRRLKNEGDWVLMCGASLALVISLMFVLYKRKVVEPLPAAVEEEPIDNDICRNLQHETV